jgi:hypothetical protein
LRRELPAPEKLKTIFALLLDTIARAEHYQGRAFAVFKNVFRRKDAKVIKNRKSNF